MMQGGKTVVSFSKKVKFIHKKIYSTIQVHFADKSSFTKKFNSFRLTKESTRLRIWSS